MVFVHLPVNVLMKWVSLGLVIYTASHDPQSRSREVHFGDRARGAKIGRSGGGEGEGSVYRKRKPRPYCGCSRKPYTPGAWAG